MTVTADRPLTHVAAEDGPTDAPLPYPTEAPPNAIDGLRFELTCPRCGALVTVVTIGRAVAGTEANAVVRCTECVPHAAEWLVMVRLVPMANLR